METTNTKANPMLELVEIARVDGMHAAVVGGKRPVAIIPAPVIEWKGYRTNPSTGGSPRWIRPATTPAGYWIKVNDELRRRRYTDYQSAVSAAIWYASRA